MSHFHKNFRFLIKNQKETQVSVAEFVGVSQTTVSNWLKGTMMPRQEKREEIARLFAISVDELINQELPHKKNIEALTELERELKELKASWNNEANRNKEIATKLAAQQDYTTAAQIYVEATSIENCSKDISKVLEIFFPDDKQNTNAG